MYVCMYVYTYTRIHLSTYTHQDLVNFIKVEGFASLRIFFFYPSTEVSEGKTHELLS
jgi:hypothetical protein